MSKNRMMGQLSDAYIVRNGAKNLFPEITATPLALVPVKMKN